MKFEKACSRKDLRAFMLLYRFMKSGQILPIPNFICTHSPSIFLDFQGVSAFGVLAVTPFLRQFRVDLYAESPVRLKLLHSLIQRFRCDMDVSVHRRFDACVPQQLLKHLRLHPAFDCPRGVSMA